MALRWRASAGCEVTRGDIGLTLDAPIVCTQVVGVGEIPSGSVALVASMLVLCACVLGAFTYAVRHRGVAVGAFAWVVLVSAVASAGLLASFDPPRPLLVFVPTLAAVVLVFRKRRDALLRFGLSAIVGFQAFRVLVELIIHQAVSEGIAPPQMSWLPGMNQDVITGVLALLLAPFATRVPIWVLRTFNAVGFALLLWVVGVAVLSMPTPIQQLEPDNVWVAHFPWVLLPVVLVSAALLGHLTLHAKLNADR